MKIKPKMKVKVDKKEKVEVKKKSTNPYVPNPEIIYNRGVWKHRVMVGTAVTGMVRIEWADRRYSQIIPTNWSLSDYKQYINATMPMRFQVSDAQNIIVQRALEQDFEWLWFIEQDNLLPQDGFIRANQYMIDKKVPVVSGLYFTKSVPPEPILYRDWGKGYFKDWKLGDKVWVKGIPTGCVLIHMSILKAMWKDAPEYEVNKTIVRRVFQEPAKIEFAPEFGSYRGDTGTSDLDWCKRVVEGDYFTKAGWPEYAKMENPFLCDTSFFVGHIDDNGRNFPLEMPPEYIPEAGYKPKDRK